MYICMYIYIYIHADVCLYLYRYKYARRVWPLLEGVIVSHGEDENLMENMCRCIRSAVQIMGLRFRDYLGV